MTPGRVCLLLASAPGGGATRTFRQPEAVATARTRQGVVAVVVIAVPVHFLVNPWEGYI